MYQVILAGHDHPNKHPFSIKLFPLDSPSDGTPFGAHGRRIMIPAHVAERYLPTLEGMAVNYRPDLQGHDPQQKIGVITTTRIENGWAIAEGHLFAFDAPDVIKRLHALSLSGELGASLESTHTFAADTGDGVLEVSSLVFTGATIMLRQAAAWKSTSVAAHDIAHPLPTESPLPMTETVTTPAAPPADATVQANDALHALLTKLAEGQTQMAAALTTLTEKVGAVQAAAAAPSPAPQAPVPVDPKDALINDLTKKLEELTGRVSAAEDAAKKNPAAPRRKTFGKESLLAKFEMQASSQGAAGDVLAEINKRLKDGELTVEQSMALKLEAAARGLINRSAE